MLTKKSLSLQICNKLFLVVFILLFMGCSNSEKDIPSTTDPVSESDSNEESTPEEEPISEEQQEHITWKNWYLSVPINRGNGKATSIFYETIENDDFTTDQKEYFYKNTDASYTFYTKFTGYTTSGESAIDAGKYCRTELREYWKGNQSTADNWSMATGTHILESTLRVNYCEGRKQTYVAQIHGIKNDALGLKNSPATIKVQWYDGNIVIEYYKKPASGEWTSNGDGKVIIGRVNNEKFTIYLKVEDGKFFYKLVCTDKNIDTGYVMLYDYVGNGYRYDNYFKTGNYFKWNSDYTQSAEVILYSAKTRHN